MLNRSVLVGPLHCVSSGFILSGYGLAGNAELIKAAGCYVWNVLVMRLTGFVQLTGTPGNLCRCFRGLLVWFGQTPLGTEDGWMEVPYWSRSLVSTHRWKCSRDREKVEISRGNEICEELWGSDTAAFFRYSFRHN